MPPLSPWQATVGHHTPPIIPQSHTDTYWVRVQETSRLSPLGRCHGLGTLTPPGLCSKQSLEVWNTTPSSMCLAWDRAQRVGVRVRMREGGRVAAEMAAEAILEDVTQFHFQRLSASRIDSSHLDPLQTSTQHTHQTHTQLACISCTCHMRRPIHVPHTCPHSPSYPIYTPHTYDP